MDQKKKNENGTTIPKDLLRQVLEDKKVGVGPALRCLRSAVITRAHGRVCVCVCVCVCARAQTKAWMYCPLTRRYR